MKVLCPSVWPYCGVVLVRWYDDIPQYVPELEARDIVFEMSSSLIKLVDELNYNCRCCTAGTQVAKGYEDSWTSYQCEHWVEV